MLNVRTTSWPVLAVAAALAVSTAVRADDWCYDHDSTRNWSGESMRKKHAASAYPGRELTTLMDKLHADTQYSTFAEAWHAADVEAELDGTDNAKWTVLVPTDAAFDRLPRGVVDALMLPENRHLLSETVNYHVVRGSTASSSMLRDEEIRLSNGDTWPYAWVDGDAAYAIGNAAVLEADIVASNGRIHAIDTVLLPAGVVDALTRDGYVLTAWHPTRIDGVVMGSSGWRDESGATRTSRDGRYDSDHKRTNSSGKTRDNNRDRDERKHWDRNDSDDCG